MKRQSHILQRMQMAGLAFLLLPLLLAGCDTNKKQTRFNYPYPNDTRFTNRSNLDPFNTGGQGYNQFGNTNGFVPVGPAGVGPNAGPEVGPTIGPEGATGDGDGPLTRGISPHEAGAHDSDNDGLVDPFEEANPDKYPALYAAVYNGLNARAIVWPEDQRNTFISGVKSIARKKTFELEKMLLEDPEIPDSTTGRRVYYAMTPVHGTDFDIPHDVIRADDSAQALDFRVRKKARAADFPGFGESLEDHEADSALSPVGKRQYVMAVYEGWLRLPVAGTLVAEYKNHGKDLGGFVTLLNDHVVLIDGAFRKKDAADNCKVGEGYLLDHPGSDETHPFCRLPKKKDKRGDGFLRRHDYDLSGEVAGWQKIMIAVWKFQRKKKGEFFDLKIGVDTTGNGKINDPLQYYTIPVSALYPKAKDLDTLCARYGDNEKLVRFILDRAKRFPSETKYLAPDVATPTDLGTTKLEQIKQASLSTSFINPLFATPAAQRLCTEEPVPPGPGTTPPDPQPGTVDPTPPAVTRTECPVFDYQMKSSGELEITTTPGCLRGDLTTVVKIVVDIESSDCRLEVEEAPDAEGRIVAHLSPACTWLKVKTHASIEMVDEKIFTLGAE